MVLLVVVLWAATGVWGSEWADRWYTARYGPAIGPLSRWAYWLSALLGPINLVSWALFRVTFGKDER